MTTQFAGFPAAAIDFYDQLADHNTREWWHANKQTYEALIRQPMMALATEAAPEGEVRVYRPYRDTRFAKDKTPIKDHQGAAIEVEDAIAYYAQISANGFMVAGGWYSPIGRQVETYRGAVDGPAGALLEKILAKLAKSGWTIDGNPVKTRPRGVDLDHPRIDLMRNRRVVATKEYGVPAWLSTREALTHLRKDWKAVTPLIEWLIDHVGPGEDPVGD